MIKLPERNLPPAVQHQLNMWQNEIDKNVDYVYRVSLAAQKFHERNKRTNATFRQVRATLSEMCSGANRCGYCEDSSADEIEHIRPKNFYPEATFVWENYLYVCGGCNTGKLSKFAVFSYATGELTHLIRRPADLVVPPEAGDIALIDPRYENPLGFMELDLLIER